MKEWKEYLERLSAQIVGEFWEKFERFFSLLAEYNSRFNLTAVKEEREVFYKHFLDSAAGEFLFPRGASVAEVGSGAGFPSVPLKILREDLSFTLIESTGKKCGFLEIVKRELGFSGFDVQKMRAEDAGKQEQFREKFDVCCARAVAPLNTLSEYCLPLVKKGGVFLAYKGDAEKELEESAHAIGLLGGKVEEILRFSLPEGYGERTLILVRKERQTPSKYPRGRGKERSEPIL